MPFARSTLTDLPSVVGLTQRVIEARGVRMVSVIITGM